MDYPVFSSEEELKAYLQENNLFGLDSEFSRTTQELVEKHEAKGFHANKWWVMTPVDWSCPACRRRKSQIVRKNKHGYLIAQLHEHHDHMRDLVKKRFEAISTSKKIVVADELAEKFAIRTSFAISAYDNTVICSDCNEADKKAKIMVGTHPDFSYSPSEICQFVIPKTNVEHAINSEKAKEIWIEGKEVFETRMRVLNMLAELAASNSHWYQPSDRTALQTERIAKFYLQRYGLREIHYDPEKLLYTTEVFKGDQASWRYKKNPKIAARPTEAQLQHLIKTRGTFWKKVESNWRCPCCNRSKIECVRPSKKNPWIFEIKNMHLYSSEDVCWLDIATLCNDCSIVATSIGREVVGRNEIYWVSSLISVYELRQIIISHPCSQHNINNPIAEKILSILKERYYAQDYYMSPRNME